MPWGRQEAGEREVLDAAGVAGWSSGRFASDESVLVPWEAPPLRSRDRRRVRVRVWGTDGADSPWSAEHPVEAGLLDAGDWTAQLVAPDWDEDTSRPQPVPLLRREFEVRGEV